MSTPNLSGKVIVVTGSTRGLGLAIAQACSAAGAAVVVSSRRADAVTATDTCAAALLACAKNFAAHGIAPPAPLHVSPITPTGMASDGA